MSLCVRTHAQVQNESGSECDNPYSNIGSPYAVPDNSRTYLIKSDIVLSLLSTIVRSASQVSKWLPVLNASRNVSK